MELSFTLTDIDNVAQRIISYATGKILLFYGEMGAGKTTLIRAIVKALGGSTEVSSPTFSIVNEYQVIDDKVFHFDFYRIEDVTEVLDIGIEDYLYSGHWIFIEWPDKIDEILPNPADISYIKINKDGSRSLKMSYSDDKNNK